MDINKERKDFETVGKSKGINESFLNDFDGKHYALELLDATWDGWLACAESKQTEIDTLKSENAELKAKLEIACKNLNSSNKAIDCYMNEIDYMLTKLSKYESDDYVLVPKEPTDKMIEYGEYQLLDMNEHVVSIYKAMIEAQGESHG